MESSLKDPMVWVTLAMGQCVLFFMCPIITGGLACFGCYGSLLPKGIRGNIV